MPVTDEYLIGMGHADQLADAEATMALDEKWLPETPAQARQVLAEPLEFGNRRQIFARHILASHVVLGGGDLFVSGMLGELPACRICGWGLFVVEPIGGNDYAICKNVYDAIDVQQMIRAKETLAAVMAQEAWPQ